MTTSAPRTSAPLGRDAWARIVALSRGRAFKVVFAMALLVAAAAILREQLRGTTAGSLLADFRSVPPLAIGAAAAATVASYVCLAASEAWALATIGRPLAPRRVLLVTFVAYAFSNGLGFGVATGGAARLRLYRPWGLKTREIGTVTLLSGAAVSAAGFVTAGLALMLVPGAPPVTLLLLAPVLLWAAPLRAVGRLVHRRRLVAVPVQARAVALAGGVLDWVFSGLALFLLLPGAAAADFAPFLAIFILGSLVSGLTGVPGGLGVLDAIVLTLSKHFAAPHETAAALLLYRLIYALGPLALVALGFAIQALRAVRRPPPVRTVGRSGR